MKHPKVAKKFEAETSSDKALPEKKKVRSAWLDMGKKENK